MSTLKSPEETREKIFNAMDSLATSEEDIVDIITSDRTHTKEVLIERLRGVKHGQNVILNCISRNDYTRASECNGHNAAIEQAIALVEEVFKSE